MCSEVVEFVTETKRRIVKKFCLPYGARCYFTATTFNGTSRYTCDDVLPHGHDEH